MFSWLRWQDLMDILIVWVVIYFIIVWTRSKNSGKLLQGIFAILLLYSFSHFLELYTVEWIMQKVSLVVMFVFLIVFQPELRQLLEKIGQSIDFKNILMLNKVSEGVFSIQFVQNITKMVDYFAENKIGSLIVVEQVNNLDSIKETGVELNADYSNELLVSIFYGKNPLHDGAVLIKGDKIMAASCLLPLTPTKLRDRSLGTRHRAALGLAELTDAIVIVTSEETGIISLAKDGMLYRKLNRKKLGEHLFSYLDVELESQKKYVRKDVNGFQRFFEKFSSWFGGTNE